MNEHVVLLADTAATMFTDLCGPDVVDAGWSDRLWGELEKAELSRISVPESAGGAGGGMEEMAALLRVAGRFSAPVPLAETQLAGWLLGAAGLPVPPGPLTVAADETLLHRSGSGWAVTGQVERVGWARRASCLVLLVGASVVTIDTSRATVIAGANLAGEPRDRIEFDDVAVAEVASVDPSCGEELLMRSALARAALMAGAAERAFDLTVRYVGERVQFGRPLARFQAVQQHVAEMAAEVSAMAVATETAALALERRSSAAALEVGAAKLLAGRSSGSVAALAHQLHGAIGVTEEHVLRHSTTRLWSWREECGHERFWGERIGSEVLAAGSERLWPRLTEVWR